jgi:hypothetical protein
VSESVEDNTTRYWKEQARGKLDIAEETEQWAHCCNKHLEIRYSSKKVDDSPSEVKNFTKLRKF